MDVGYQMRSSGFKAWLAWMTLLLKDGFVNGDAFV